MRVAIIIWALAVVGCGAQFKHTGEDTTESVPVKKYAAVYSAAKDMQALEDKIDQLTRAVESMQAVSKVAMEDRAEIMAFNKCQAYCESHYPWPDKPESMDIEVWRTSGWVNKAQDNRRKCNSECDKRKPKAQPDWSC